MLGTLLGILLALAIVHDKATDLSVMPWIITSQTIPILALAPMIIVVLSSIGFTGLLPKAVISMYLSFFPIVVGINADAATATKQLFDEIRKQKLKLDVSNWTNTYHNQRKEFLINRDKYNLGKNFPIQPKGLFKELRKVLPKDSSITLDLSLIHI